MFQIGVNREDFDAGIFRSSHIRKSDRVSRHLLKEFEKRWLYGIRNECTTDAVE